MKVNLAIMHIVHEDKLHINLLKNKRKLKWKWIACENRQGSFPSFIHAIAVTDSSAVVSRKMLSPYVLREFALATDQVVLVVAVAAWLPSVVDVRWPWLLLPALLAWCVPSPVLCRWWPMAWFQLWLLVVRELLFVDQEDNVFRSQLTDLYRFDMLSFPKFIMITVSITLTLITSA